MGALTHPSRRLVKSIAAGNYHSPFRGQGLEFDSVREYVPGDDIRSIDWRVTARTGSPHVKLFRADRERYITICVDMNAPMRFGTRNTFKSVQAARVAALLGWRAIACQDRVSACLFGDVPAGIQLLPPKRSRRSFCAMLKILSEPPKEQHQVLLDGVLQQIYATTHTGSLVYIISDFMNIDNNFQDVWLGRLCKKCDVVFIAVNDRADKAIAPIGVIGCGGSERQKTYINTDSIAGRRAYEALWKQNRQKLYEITSKLKIPVIELTTESDIYREIILGLKKGFRK